jgi:hypothetical protein
MFTTAGKLISGHESCLVMGLEEDGLLLEKDVSPYLSLILRSNTIGA